MALPNDYAGQVCSLARALEIVGERWTLLIVRDAFYGVRRFGDFAAHLGIPRAVLSDRLKTLTAAGVLERVPGGQGRDGYRLTTKGETLWPAVRALTAWGEEHYAPNGPRRVLRHAADDAPLAADGHCTACGTQVPARDTIVAPGPGLDPASAHDPVGAALNQPHRLLHPLHTV